MKWREIKERERKGSDSFFIIFYYILLYFIIGIKGMNKKQWIRRNESKGILRVIINRNIKSNKSNHKSINHNINRNINHNTFYSILLHWLLLLPFLFIRYK